MGNTRRTSLAVRSTLAFAAAGLSLAFFITPAGAQEASAGSSAPDHALSQTTKPTDPGPGWAQTTFVYKVGDEVVDGEIVKAGDMHVVRGRPMQISEADFGGWLGSNNQTYQPGDIFKPYMLETFVFTAVINRAEPVRPVHTLTFRSGLEGVADPAGMTVEGTTLSAGSLPKMENTADHRFLGWSLDGSPVEGELNLGEDNSSVTLTGRWERTHGAHHLRARPV